MTAQTVGDRWLACIVSPWNPNDTEAQHARKERWDFIKCVALGALAVLGAGMAPSLAGAVVDLVAAPPLVGLLVVLVVTVAACYGLIKAVIFLGDTYQKTYDPSLSLGSPRRSFEAVKKSLLELASTLPSESGSGLGLHPRLYRQELVPPRKGFLFYSLLLSDQESRDVLNKICREPETQLCRAIRAAISSCWVKIATKLPESELFKILTPDENCRQLLAQLQAHQEKDELSPEEQQSIADKVLQLKIEPAKVPHLDDPEVATPTWSRFPRWRP